MLKVGVLLESKADGLALCTKTYHNALARRIAPSRTGGELGGQLMRCEKRITDASPTRRSRRGDGLAPAC